MATAITPHLTVTDQVMASIEATEAEAETAMAPAVRQDSALATAVATLVLAVNKAILDTIRNRQTEATMVAMTHPDHHPMEQDRATPLDPDTVQESDTGRDHPATGQEPLAMARGLLATDNPSVSHSKAMVRAIDLSTAEAEATAATLSHARRSKSKSLNTSAKTARTTASERARSRFLLHQARSRSHPPQATRASPSVEVSDRGKVNLAAVFTTKKPTARSLTIS